LDSESKKEAALFKARIVEEKLLTLLGFELRRRERLLIRGLTLEIDVC
jgi:hypothetical protein